MEKRVVKVNIFGTEYPIKGESNVEYIQEIARFVDEKMIEIDKTLSIKSSLKVAILAALNIADELFQEREEKNKLKELYEKKVEVLNNRLSKEVPGLNNYLYKKAL